MSWEGKIGQEVLMVVLRLVAKEEVEPMAVVQLEAGEGVEPMVVFLLEWEVTDP